MSVIQRNRKGEQVGTGQGSSTDGIMENGASFLKQVFAELSIRFDIHTISFIRDSVTICLDVSQ